MNAPFNDDSGQADLMTNLPTPLIFTDSAANKVRELIEEEGNNDLKLRVFVAGGTGVVGRRLVPLYVAVIGCPGFIYGFTFDELISEDDTVMEKNGVKLLVDAMSFQYLVGAEIDYQENAEGAQFIIKNPGAASTCGCGSSFSV